jgi:hypothetical protein
MNFKIKYIMLLLALSVAGCAAYFSVWGLSQLFAGASTAVIIMASVLEVGKIVTTTALHTYWDKLAKGLRAYLTLSVVVLMLITSAGIYGFLSNAYQKTANKLEIHEGELSVLGGKKQIFEKSVLDNQKIIDSKSKRIDQLSGLRTAQEARLDGSNSNRARNGVRGDILSANTEIQKLSTDIDALNVKNASLSDSISKYNTKALELKSGSEVAAEVGPLKYIAELTGLPMAKVVNYLILLLIFVFDPLAVALILITNRVFQIESGQFIPEPEMAKIKKESILAKIKNYKRKIKEVKNVKVQTKPDVDVSQFKSPGVFTREFDNFPIEPIVDNEEPILENIPELEPEVEEVPELEPEIEEIPEQEPEVEEVVPHLMEQPTYGKIQLDDIKEIKDRNRGFSVNIPNPRNTIQRMNGITQLPKDKNNAYLRRS